MPEVNYPRWKYHPNKPAVVVNSAKEEKDLGPGWFDSPDPEAQKAEPLKSKPGKPAPVIVSYGPASAGPERRIEDGFSPTGIERRVKK